MDAAIQLNFIIGGGMAGRHLATDLGLVCYTLKAYARTMS
jgi:hypothetical protein